MLTLIGVAVVIFGFALRQNPLLVVILAAVATGLAGGIAPVAIVTDIGRAYTENRYLALVWFTLPVIGMLERNGLREQAQALIVKVRGATTGRVLTAYLALRQLTCALGLNSLGGHAQMVRPLVAPMAEAAAETRYGALPEKTRHLIRAHAAAADNIGAFFGEDIFLAFGSVLLIKGFLEQNGIVLTPIQIALWSIPTALAAFLIQSSRLWWLDRRLRAELEKQP
ncbi:MAG TPA: DUF969 domain-containing protein [Gammaproteobacteria bacterium]|nr:DUF969 domain-containing protein [Gammaproteobacteria bacterium]